MADPVLAAAMALDAAFDFGHRETPTELLARGQATAQREQTRAAAFEAVLACEPTVEFAEMERHRILASQGLTGYARAHAEARRQHRPVDQTGEQGRPLRVVASSRLPRRSRKVLDPAFSGKKRVVEAREELGFLVAKEEGSRKLVWTLWAVCSGE